MPKGRKGSLTSILSKHTALLWFIKIFLLYGIILFGVKGVLIFALQTPTPMTGVTSGSMEPVLHRGDLVIIEGYDNVSQVEVGDIIVFEVEGHRFIHRVHKVEFVDSQPRFITKGDANSQPDDWIVIWEDINGKVIFHVPYLGYPSVLV